MRGVGEVGTLERRRARGHETVQHPVAELPHGMHDPRARAVVAIDGRQGAPDDAVGNGDELLSGRHTTMIAQCLLWI